MKLLDELEACLRGCRRHSGVEEDEDSQSSYDDGAGPAPRAKRDSDASRNRNSEREEPHEFVLPCSHHFECEDSLARSFSRVLREKWRSGTFLILNAGEPIFR